MTEKPGGSVRLHRDIWIWIKQEQVRILKRTGRQPNQSEVLRELRREIEEAKAELASFSRAEGMAKLAPDDRRYLDLLVDELRRPEGAVIRAALDHFNGCGRSPVRRR